MEVQNGPISPRRNSSALGEVNKGLERVMMDSADVMVKSVGIGLPVGAAVSVLSNPTVMALSNSGNVETTALIATTALTGVMGLTLLKSIKKHFNETASKAQKIGILTASLTFGAVGFTIGAVGTGDVIQNRLEPKAVTSIMETAKQAGGKINQDQASKILQQAKAKGVRSIHFVKP